MPKALRWLLFVVGIGCLVACGVYLGRLSGDLWSIWRLLRALMFLLLGLFFILMYGENESRSGGTGTTQPGPD